MQFRTRRILVFVGSMIGAWTLASFVGMEFVRPSRGQLVALNSTNLIPSDTLDWRLLRALVAGTSAGLLASFLELKALSRKAMRYGAAVMLLMRTIAYAAVALVSILATVRVIARRDLNVPVREFLSSEGFQAFLRSPDFARLLLVLIVASFIINAWFQVSRLLGPGTALQILLGRYIRPVEEDRAFLFVDLADSTTLAEDLGPLKFAELKNDFFHDVAEPVLDTGGQIVQYVGDEVMITWPRQGSRGAADSVRCFFMLHDRVQSRAKEYEARYGLVPEFRAGLHGGLVVVSQLGDLKREIVFSGDAVNTASRIQGLCRSLGVDFLASGEVLSQAELPDRIEVAALGERSLRGRVAPVQLVSLIDSSAAVSEEEASPD